MGEKKRLMGLDYGAKTVGVAISDELGFSPHPLETIIRKEENKLRKTLARLTEIIADNHIELIVLGRPVHMDGSVGERVKFCEEFKEKLEKRVHIPIVWKDERLTTYAADEILEQSGIAKKDRKKYIDSVAASIILGEFMNDTK